MASAIQRAKSVFLLSALALLLCAAGISAQTTPTCHSMVPGQEGSLSGFVPFSSSLWNKDISTAAVDPNSTAIINFIGTSKPLHPDFGSGTYDGSSIGIPYIVTSGSQPNVVIHYTDYPDESDPQPMPIPSSAPIEGYPAPGSGDRHVLVLNQGTCWLYELYNAYLNPDGTWNASNTAVWDLTTAGRRPYGWTSADAAGLSILAGLVRYDEVAAGKISHALRFTLQNSRAAFTPPATHWAANSSNPLAAPMGMRLRLKSSVDISSFSAANRVILTALKTYGMVMADNGSSMFLSGTPDSRWNNDDLHELNQLTAADFEVVKMSSVSTTIPSGAAPSITSFKSSASSVAKGTKVTFTWAAINKSYLHLSPIGMVRGSSTTYVVNATTTFTLTATGPYGTTSSSITVTAH
jgi:hypothetical protein